MFSSTHPTLQCVLGQNKDSFLWNTVPNSALKEISLRPVDRSNVLSTLFDKVDAYCDKLYSDLRQSKVDTACNGRLSTDDFGQFIPLSVHV